MALAECCSFCFVKAFLMFVFSRLLELFLLECLCFIENVVFNVKVSYLISLRAHAHRGLSR